MRASNVLFILGAGLLCLGVLLGKLITAVIGRLFSPRGVHMDSRRYCSYPVYKRASW